MTDAGGPSSGLSALSALRASFDDVDAQLVALLARRAKLSREAGDLKRAHGLQVVDEDREARAAAARADLARRQGVDEALVDAVFAAIVQHSRRVQGAPE